MNQLVICGVIALAAVAMGQYGYYGAGYGDPFAQPTPYSFGYESPSLGGSHSHQESGDGYGNKQGSYTLTLADGRTRTVNYVADETGFHPEIITNEPGTETSGPANAHYESQAPTGVEAALQEGYGYGGYGGYGGIVKRR